jgi:integrase
MSAEQKGLVLRPRAGSGEKVYWDAQWRCRPDPQEPWGLKKQRLGLAWLEQDGQGGWRRRKGRCPVGWLDERAAHLAADRAMTEYGKLLVSAQQRARSERERLLTVREVAREWLTWLEQVRGAKPSTLRDYRTLLREPGEPYKRGNGASEGRIMATFGDLSAAAVSTSDVSRFLRSLDAENFTPRNVNKYRQVLQAMFAYGCREDTFALPGNPVDGSDKRRESPPAALDYYEIEEVEALARVCERGEHRATSAVTEAELDARAGEDRQDAEAFRVLFYTGIRIGELLTLRWSDVDLPARSLLVRRNLSAGVETEPKGRRHRYVPLPDPALATLARLGTRDDFIGEDEYVVCNRWGRRLDASALRRRYHRACEVAGLRRVKLHGLRHAAGSILARTADAVFVRDFLGHSKLSTTDRYVGAKHRPEDYERLNRAFAPPGPNDPTPAPSPSPPRVRRSEAKSRPRGG